MDIESLIESVYIAHRKSKLYDDCFENVIFKLTNAYDYFSFEAFRDAFQGNPFIRNEYSDIDKYRHSYRACIKFVVQDCPRGNFDEKIDIDNLRSFQNEIKETVQFNYIRNTIDRYKLGRFNAKIINNGELQFTPIEANRPFIYDVYSRLIADTIPGSKNSKDDINVFNFYEKILRLALAKPTFESKKVFKPSKNILLPLLSELFVYFFGDLETKVANYKISNYRLKDYVNVYCYIVAIAMYKTAYLLSLPKQNRLTYQPSFLYPKGKLIEDISDTVGLPIEIVNSVLDDMVYDYNFHKNKVTIFQPLFEVGDKILCSSQLLFHSYVIDKLMKYIDVKGTNKKVLTVYHKYMSDRMNHRMAERLSEMYPNLKCYENCVLNINGLDEAEIDLTVFDLTSKTGALIELKNYSPIENESDAINKEKKINQAIEWRLVKNEKVLKNMELFLSQNSLPDKYCEFEISSILITNSYSGGVGIKEGIKVVDEPLFYNLLWICGGNLLETIKMIKTGEFFEMLKKEVAIPDAVYHYKGIIVKVSAG